MRKYQLLALLISFAGLHVYAADGANVNKNGLVDADQLELQLNNEMQHSVDQAQSLESPEWGPGRGGGHHGPPHGPPHRRPYPPRPYPPYPPPGPRWVTCFAQDWHGLVYQASGVYPRATQDAAMNECWQQSPWGRCAPAGCR